MDRRTFIRASSLALAANTFPPRGFSTDPKRPNVVLILIDDLGWWDLGVNGNEYVETPVIDRLAREGVRMSHFYATPLCSPTRACLLTGRHYQRTGVVEPHDRGRYWMRTDEVTLGEVLQKHGYRTAVVGKWHLGDHMKYHPNNRGFDESFGLWSPGAGDIPNYFNSEELFHNRQRVGTWGYVTDVLTDYAVGFVEKNRATPFFLYLPYNVVHSPYMVPDNYLEKYLMKGLPLWDARIYGMATNLDENIGRLLKTLDNAGVRENTIVIFASDNGGVSRYFNAGLRGAKGDVYEGGVRVPFFARWPGKFPAGVTVNAMAHHIDIFPTLCELTGTPLPADRKLDGKSILSLLRKGSAESPHQYLFHQWNCVRPLLTEPSTPPANLFPDEVPCFKPNWAVRNARGYKLVKSMKSANPREELFDLEADPGETQDLAADHPEIVRELRGEFERWFAEVTAGHDYARPAIEVGRPDENPVRLEVKWAESEVESGSVRWRIEVMQMGQYEVGVKYASEAADAGSKLSIRAGNSEIEHVVQATGSRTLFQTFFVGRLNLSKGQSILEMKPISAGGEQFVLRQRFRSEIWLKKVD